MKGIKKGLAILLVLCTLLSMVAMTGAAAPQSDDVGDAQTMAADSGTDEFLRIFSLDCGRIYFSVEQIEAIIDNLAKNDYTHLQLAFGNGGLRFLLDDMSVTVDETTYPSDNVKSAIQAGNTYYARHDGHDGSQAANTCLTQTEMNTILTYASGKGIQIIPLLNSPGHFNAVVYAMGQLGITNAGYPVSGENSPSTVNINNDTAKAFATALIQKYITYFKEKGCTYFHMGADEFANDPTDTNKLGFTAEIKESFVTYVNSIASMIADARMTPVMFNDGYAWMNADFNANIVVSYWTGGRVSSTQIANEGHKIINTNQAWYYVLGSPFGAEQDKWCSYASATNGVTNTRVTSLVDGGSVGDKLIGAAMCFWCDYTNQTYTKEEQTKVGTLISTLATNNPDYFAVQQEETITVVVGGTKEVGVSSETITEQPDSTYASVGIERTETPTGKYVQVDSIESGKQYILVNQGVCVTNITTKSNNVSGLKCASFSASDTAVNYNNYLWRITEVSGGYTVQDANGKYLNVAASNDNANVTLTKTAQALTISDLGTTFTIANGSTYFDRFDPTFAAGWGDSNAGPSNQNEQWALYEYQEAPAYTMTVTGNAIGTTYVTVGDTTYKIVVSDEDVTTVSPLKVHLRITTFPVWEEGDSAKVNYRDISAKAIHSEEGVALSDLVPNPTDWEYEGKGCQTVFWRGTVLPEGKHQSTDTQNDRTGDGTSFTKLRRWDKEWQYFSEKDNSWKTIIASDEVVAYYLQSTEVTDEVTTMVKDWGFKPEDAHQDDGATDRQVALSFAVVYSTGQLSPSEENIMNQSTIIYHLHNANNPRDIGLAYIANTEGYEVSKITWTAGTRDQNKSSAWTEDDTVTWNKTTADGVTWYDETTIWTSEDGTDPVIRGTEIDYQWEQPGDACLILIYVKARADLTVRYWDDSANTEIYNYGIAVDSNIDFNNGLTPKLTNDDLADNAYIVNYKNQHETFEKNLTQIPALHGKYASGLYSYVRAEISEDGKTLTLHYNLDSSKLSKNYVVDFGLPVEIPLSDFVANADAINSVTVATPVNGTVTIDTDKNIIRYAPERAYTGVVTLSVTVTFTDGTTQVFSVGITPATTVYYEEGFAVPYAGKGIVAGSKGTATQTAEAAGEKTYVYGYDPAYANTIPNELAGGAIMLDASGEGVSFEFTGTGVDIYTNSSPATGTVMVYVYKGTGSSKVFQRLITVDTAMRNGTTDATASQNVTAYNVPIVSLAGLEHGTYTVEVDVVMSKVTNSDNTTTKSLLPVYIDGFRVHGTLENQANDVYTADQEDSPVFIELRDKVLAGLRVNTNESKYADQIAKNALSQVYATSSSTEGAVLLSTNDTFSSTTDVQDLLDNGPKNEIYLQPNQALTFKVTTNRVVQIGLKALNQATTYTITGKDTNQTLNASTDMFYEVKGKTDDATEQTITITNTGNGILSITELKICDDPNAMLGELTAEDLIPALVSLGYEVEPVDAEAALNITVQAGDQTVTTQLTATGTAGESHIFTAAEIKAAAEAVLPDDYTLDGVTFEDVTVVCGEQGETSYTAEAVQNPTPDQPTKVLQKLLAVIKNIFKRLFRWL